MFLEPFVQVHPRLSAIRGIPRAIIFSMTIDADAEKILKNLDSLGLDAATEQNRGWQSRGTIVVDASLQRQQNYARTVRPRVAALVTEWPEACTTSGFRRRLNSGKLAEVIRWPKQGRLTEINELTKVLERPDIAIETFRTYEITSLILH